MEPKTLGEEKSDDKKMVDKVNQQMSDQDDGIMAKVIGLGLILFGLVFVVLAVVVVILSNREAQVDDQLEVPTLKVEEYTNKDTVKVKGTTESNGSVIFFIDGEETGVTLEADDDGNFEGEIPVPEDEKVYEVTAAQVVGFPLRKRSQKTEPVAFIVDTTDPSADAELEYDPVSSDGKFNISGKVEEGTVVTITDGENEYVTTANEEGVFEIEGIELNAETTTFEMTIADLAGNEKTLERKIEVSWPDYELIAGGENGNGEGNGEDGDINGPGASTGPEDGDVAGEGTGKDQPDLPEAAGELDAAMSVILGNQLMFIFGLIAVAVLLVNSGIVAIKIGNR